MTTQDHFRTLEAFLDEIQAQIADAPDDADLTVRATQLRALLDVGRLALDAARSLPEQRRALGEAQAATLTYHRALAATQSALDEARSGAYMEVLRGSDGLIVGAIRRPATFDGDATVSVAVDGAPLRVHARKSA